MWLLNRLFDQGDQPTPRFAFQGTVNWMRALSLYCDNGDYSNEQLRAFYSQVLRRQQNIEADTLAFENITMAMHNVSALESMNELENPYPTIRSAIVAWYYSTYYSSKAMLAASSGADPQTHASAGKIFHTEIVENNLAKSPFDIHHSNLTPANTKKAISLLRNGNNHDLNTTPEDLDMAFGALCSYLSGTADYEKGRLEEQVKQSSQYKKGGFTNFRKNAAKTLRDAKLSPAKVNYLVQAFRYRGKANYRDAIYLSYGSNNSERLDLFVKDLTKVSAAYTLMAAHYVSRRVVHDDWISLCTDLNTYGQFAPPFDLTEI